MRNALPSKKNDAPPKKLLARRNAYSRTLPLRCTSCFPWNLLVAAHHSQHKGGEQVVVRHDEGEREDREPVCVAQQPHGWSAMRRASAIALGGYVSVVSRNARARLVGLTSACTARHRFSLHAPRVAGLSVCAQVKFSASFMKHSGANWERSAWTSLTQPKRLPTLQGSVDTET
eukprot:SAG11_NODE_1414_length_4978_cov_31.434720_3_plen_174_part_00